MTFVSYAQNFEDIILWRALKHVENGFYIDVGAQDPVTHSVSRGFYEQGWRGVHVEASSHFAELLRVARTDEEVLEIAIDAIEGQLAFFEIPETGLSTGDPDIAQHHQKQGWEVIQRNVPCIPLSAVLDRYADRDIHWLKIDIEGLEEAAISGWLPSEVRPWVVIVESTRPLSTEPSHELWDGRLTSLGYEYVYFDGLNRFYVSQSHPEIKSAFGLAPNIFDEFVLAPTSSFASAILIETAAARLALEEELRDQRQTVVELRAAQASAEQQLLAMRNSRSWLITAPLRQIPLSLHLTVNGIVAWATFRPGSRPRRILRTQLVVALDKVKANPKLMSLARRFARLSPQITNRLRSIYFSAPGDADGATIWKYDPNPRALEKWLTKLNS